ncbi:hypothetical protein Daus18300_003018 [Diaporthe australafricana]|uniref:Uncharacterized protein n=1 Tax=Diaporthe australafricana TaxID=127596 RepID=A0ABR3XJY8_9PEZI
MCVQVNNLFKCGHRAFDKFDNCPEFGKSCFGAGGKHKDVAVDRVCHDCKQRESHANSPAAGTPESSGEGASGEKKDPWWEGDPWRKYRKG